jgi:cation:H+ antiporter
MLLEIVLLAIGIALLVKGADMLVDAAEKLALAAGVPVLVIGFTLVAAGTSVPELVVDTGAALSGVGELAVGDIVGSNIVDICLILGIAAVIRPVVVHRSVMKLEIPAAIAISLLFLAVAFDGSIGRLDGMILIGAALVYFYLILQKLKKTRQPEAGRRPAGLADAARFVTGLIAIILGGRLTLDAAIGIAGTLGVSTYLIGLLVVAVGTSLPELATAITASRKGSGDLVLGNCIGSFTFNALVIIGICALITPLPVPGLLDPVVMAVAAILLVPHIMIGGHVLERREGLFLVAFYLAYVGYKVVTAGT